MSPKGVNFDPFTASSSPPTSPSPSGRELAGGAAGAVYSSLDSFMFTSDVVSRKTPPYDSSSTSSTSSTPPMNSIHTMNSSDTHLPYHPSGQVPSTEAVPCNRRRAHNVRFKDNITTYSERPATNIPNDNILDIAPQARESSIGIHCLLRRGKLVFNLGMDPDSILPTLSEDGQTIPAEDLDEPAVLPEVSKLFLVGTTFPWRLEIREIKASSPRRGYVSVGDVLKGLFLQLQVAVTSSEMRGHGDLDEAKIAQKQRIADSTFTGHEDEKKVLRLDFLYGYDRFGGLGEMDTKELMAKNRGMSEADAKKTFKFHVEKLSH